MFKYQYDQQKLYKYVQRRSWQTYLVVIALVKALTGDEFSDTYYVFTSQIPTQDENINGIKVNNTS